MNQTAYYLEAAFFPDLFFSDRCQEVLGSLMTGKGTFCIDVLKWANRDDSTYSCPYEEQQFIPHIYKVKSGNAAVPYFYMLQLTMPEPDISPLSKRVYFCHDEAYDHRRFFTVEKTVRNGWMLCEWDGKGVHINHGDCSEDLNAELELIEDLYIESLPI